MSFIKGIISSIGRLHKNEPALFNAVLVLVAVLIQHFTLNYGTDIKVAIDGILIALGAGATRQVVAPTAKLVQAGIDPKLPKVQ